MLRTALTGAAAGAAAYAAADLAADVAAFSSLQRQALELAERDGAVEAAVGPRPWRAAAWHSLQSGGATLAYSHRGHAARATFSLAGPKGVTDVVARGVRGPGPAWNALYQLMPAPAPVAKRGGGGGGGGENDGSDGSDGSANSSSGSREKWALASCAAMVPGPGGVARPRELMEPRSLAHAWAAAGGTLAPVATGGARNEERGRAASAAAAAKEAAASGGKGGRRSWWGRWPRRRREAEGASSGDKKG